MCLDRFISHVHLRALSMVNSCTSVAWPLIVSSGALLHRSAADLVCIWVGWWQSNAVMSAPALVTDGDVVVGAAWLVARVATNNNIADCFAARARAACQGVIPVTIERFLVLSLFILLLCSSSHLSGGNSTSLW